MTEDELIQKLGIAIKECFCLFVKIKQELNLSGKYKTYDIGNLCIGNSLLTFDLKILSIIWNIASLRTYGRPFCFMCYRHGTDPYIISWKSRNVESIGFGVEHNEHLKRMINLYPEVVYPILRLPEIVRNFIDEN